MRMDDIIAIAFLVSMVIFFFMISPDSRDSEECFEWLEDIDG